MSRINLLAERGTTREVIAVSQDISKRKQAEAELEQRLCQLEGLYRLSAAVSRADSSRSVRYGSPAAKASCRARSPSLNTTRAQPNALASAAR